MLQGHFKKSNTHNIRTFTVQNARWLNYQQLPML